MEEKGERVQLWTTLLLLLLSSFLCLYLRGVNGEEKGKGRKEGKEGSSSLLEQEGKGDQEGGGGESVWMGILITHFLTKKGGSRGLLVRSLVACQWPKQK